MSDILGVRIQDGDIDRHVTRHCSGLSFRKVAGGGAADAQVKIGLPRTAFPDLGAADKVTIYDAATGQTVWEGHAQNPGRSTDDTGESFDLNALGIYTVTRQRATPLIYRETSYESWRPDDTGNTASASADVGTFPDGSGSRAGKPGVYTQLTPGTPVGTGTGKAMMLTTLFEDAGMALGGFTGYRDGGSDTPDFRSRLAAYPFTGWLIDTDLATPGVDVAATAGVDFPHGKTGLLFGLAHIGAATNVTTDNIWAALEVSALLGARMDKYGRIYNLPRLDYVLASEVIADMVGRLGVFDPQRVSIEATSYQIDQLAYTEPTRMQQVLDDLALYEPDFTFEVLPSVGGRYGFTYRAWPTEPRYEVGPGDNYAEQGSDDELANRIAVHWKDATDNPRTTIVVSDVPALGGQIVDADPIDMGTATLEKALRLGQQLLGALAQPSRSGTATLTGRIKDLYTGGWVLPHQVEPGYLVRVRESGRDMRLTETNYSHDDRSVALTLGDPIYTTEQRIAAISTGRALRTAASGYVAPRSTFNNASYSTLYTYA